MIPWFIDMFFSLFLLIISGFIYIQAKSFPEISQKFPNLVVVCLVVFALLLMISSIKRKGEKIEKDDSDYKSVVKIIIGMVVYTIILRVVGYALSTVGLVGYTIYVMGYKKKKNITIIAFCSIIVIYMIFKLVLHVPLPKGFFNVI